MNGKAFFDSNIICYAFDTKDKEKKEKAKELLKNWMSSGKLVISTQVLQEVFVVLTRKTKPPLKPEKTKEILEVFLPFEIVQITPELIFKAIDILIKHRISFWDALIISAAVKAKCKVVFTEDLNDGQIIEGVTIINPFR